MANYCFGFRGKYGYGLVFGVERVLNGTFDTAITGWSPIATGTLIWDAGTQSALLTIVNVATDGASYTTTPTVVGKKYRIKIDFTAGTYVSTLKVTYGGVTTSSLANNTSHQFDIVATSASTALTILGDGVGDGTVYFDNVSVHEIL